MTLDQANTLKALISVGRTRAIRHHLNKIGKGAPAETLHGTERSDIKARHAVEEFINNLIEAPK